MITSKGSGIISKYLLGQAPEYASYLAIGVGAEPLEIDENDNSSPSKKSMEFEAFRVPVTSRGLVNDYVSVDLESWVASTTLLTVTTSTYHGVRVGETVDLEFSSEVLNSYEDAYEVLATTSNTISLQYSGASASWSASASNTGTVSYNRERMIFKAQLPVDQYYKMTEIALYPAATNSLAQQYDSKIIAGFLSNENWILYSNNAGIDIPSVTRTLSDTSGDITQLTFAASVEPLNARYVSSDNETFTFFNRKSRYEGPRLYNTGLMVAGNTSQFNNSNLDVSASTSYIQTNNISVDMRKNSKNDYIRLAICVVSNLENPGSNPYHTRIRLEMLDEVSGSSATMKQTITSSNISSSRYYVISKKLSDFSIGENFSWARVAGIKIYAQTVNSLGQSTSDYIILDGIRLDNENTLNPLYGMVAYSKLKNGYESGQPIEKIENSQGYIEYRMGVNIV